jgi:hypothetical protein
LTYAKYPNVAIKWGHAAALRMNQSLVAPEFEFDSLRQRVLSFEGSLISRVKTAHLAAMPHGLLNLSSGSIVI